NDSARAMMAVAAKFRDDVAGAVATGGSLVAYTLTSYQSFDTLAHMDGAMIAFTPHATNGGACTLNVDALGAKPLRAAPAQELAIGVLVAGTPYAATYYNVSGEWILRGAFAGAVVPLGVALPFFATALPGSNFAFPFGQAISRTTYAALFTLFGTTYGAGDGATTFNLPDLRGYRRAGKDARGGAAASRITAAHSGIAGSTLGAAGGAETVTLASGHMPVHSHGVNDPTHAHGVSDPTHAHGVSDPTHAHSVLAVPNQTAGAQSGTRAFGAAQGTNIGTAGAATGVSVNAAATGIGIAAAATGISIGNAGSSLEHQNMPPTRICNFIMRIL